MLFVREFRPISRHSFSFHLFHPAQRKDYMMVKTRPVGFWLFVLGCVGSLFFSPPSDCSSLPSTMTWAPCPHGVRTRGKNTTATMWWRQRTKSRSKGKPRQSECREVRTTKSHRKRLLHTEVRHVPVEPGMRISGVEKPSAATSGPPARHRGQPAAWCFQMLLRLQHLDLGKKGQGFTNLNGILPDCCFLKAGLVALYLPSDFNRIETAACVSCQQLRIVDLCQTDVIEILSSTFAHCSQLQLLNLSGNCASLSKKPFLSAPRCKVCILPSLLYIARRAFAGCTQLRAVRKQGKSKTWRGTQCPAQCL